MNLVDLLLNELAAQVVAFIIVVSVVTITFLFNQLKKQLEIWFGIDVAEWEVYNVARRVLNYTKEHEKVAAEVYSIVSERLEKKNIPISKDELADIIENTLEDLQENTEG